jgi:ribosomal protein S18 acetylase RimI-like enzyme
MNISKAVQADITPIMELIQEAVRVMNEGGLHQWDDQYPNVDIITEDIAAKSLHKITADGKIAGIIVLSEEYFPGYDKLKWEDEGSKFLIVHRLCVHPDFQGQGLAKKLMTFAEEYAMSHYYTSIRLDTFTGNQIALGLYDSIGYRRVGLVRFRLGSFQVFEKVLKNGVVRKE